MGTIQPWTITSGGINSVILKVNNDDFEKAKRIIDDYERGNLNIELEETENK